jgi:NADPH-dependent curcumin reductase CurA
MTGQMNQIVLNSYARGNPKASDFTLQKAPIPAARDREILLKTLWLALDPLYRFAIDEVRVTGQTHLRLGDVMAGGTVSEVMVSHHPDYAVGDIVEGRTGWCEFAVVAPDQPGYRGAPRKIDRSLAPVSTALGALGMPGQTAHACAIEIGRVKAGETVVISAAAGAVGSLAGQIAKIQGARVVGIAGGAQKCEALLGLGFDAAVDYRAATFVEDLKTSCPKGIDVYIDNVGGNVTLAVMPLLNYRARMPLCGFIAYYGVGLEGPGPDHLPGFFRMVMSKGLEVRGFGGFIVGGEQALKDMVQWMREDKIRFPEAIVEGLESAPSAFAGVFAGNAHVGKLLVKVAELTS